MISWLLQVGQARVQLGGEGAGQDVRPKGTPASPTIHLVVCRPAMAARRSFAVGV